MSADKDASRTAAELSERLRKAAAEVRALKRRVKVARRELDPEHVLNFLRFFGSASR